MKTLWNVNTFISSYLGMYVVQTVLHSIIASVLVDCALIAWDMKTPHVKQRFRFMVILLPVVSFPLYQLLFPGRGGMYFRLDTLLDSNKWFLLELWDGIPVFAAFAVILALSTAVFVIQELVPIAFNMIEQIRGAAGPAHEDADEALTTKVAKALEDLPLREDAVEILDDDDLELFSSTGLKPRIYVSSGMVKSFSNDHLQAAFAHEIGHIRRSRKPVLIFAYILRAMMFYNPVAMIEFRKLVDEEEKVCDDIAVALTGKPEALFEAVDMLRPESGDYVADEGRGTIRGLAAAIEHHSHNALMKSRATRIRVGRAIDFQWGVQYFVTMAFIVGINYFVV